MTAAEIGDLVRERRKSLRMTKVQLSGLSGVSRVRIAQLESGNAFDMSLSKASSILGALGLSLQVVPIEPGRPTLDELQDRKDELYNTPGLD